MKRHIAIAGIIAMISASSAQASLFGELRSDRSTQPTKVGSNVMPASNFTGQRWVHPNGCQYSRAGRPGETVWYLVATGAKGCAAYIVQHSPYGDY